MTSTKKIISVNPNFLRVGNTRKKEKNKRARQQRTKLNFSLKPNSIKKDLLRRIKEHQKREKEKHEYSKSTKENIVFNTEFKSAMNSLEDIVKKNKQAKQKKEQEKRKKERGKQHQSIKNRTFKKDVHGGFRNIHSSQLPVHMDSIASQSTSSPILVVNTSSQHKDPPPYGCLKGGNKPTFRQYNRTLKARRDKIDVDRPHMIHKNPTNQHTKIEISSPIIQSANNSQVRQQKLQKLKDTFRKKTTMSSNKPKKYKIQTTRKIYKLGKYGGKVQVLIKNNKTRKNINKAIKLLNKKSLLSVKKYLKQKHLLKTGSTAPEYILREMYKNAILSGDIHNKNNDILVHNYLH